MKKMKKIMTMVMVVATMAFSSCTKEDNQTSNSNYTSSSNLRTFDNNWDLPTGEIRNLSDNNELKNAVENTNEYNLVSSTNELDKNNSRVICYGNPNKFTVFFPINNEPNSYYCFTFTELSLNHCEKVKISGTQEYLNQMPGGVLFADMSIPFSGEINIYNLDNEPEAIIHVEDGSAKPYWTPHGGFGSWFDCVAWNGSQWWAVLGGAICPECLVVALAVGCL